MTWWCDGGVEEGGGTEGVDDMVDEREGGGMVVAGAGRAEEVVALRRVAWQASHLYLGASTPQI